MTDYLEGSLSARDRTRLEGHLAACPHCSEYLAQIRATIDTAGNVQPEDLTTDPSNRDSNKGLVTIRYEPYRELADGMREFNRQAYRLADFFDRG